MDVYCSLMDSGDWATWVGSIAAVTAAVASVAAWRNGRPGVKWEFQYAEHGRSLVLNSGSSRAMQVHVRAGSIVDVTDFEAEEQADRISPGEGIRILVAPTYGSSPDYGVVVTWQAGFGRRQRWVYLPH